MEAPIGSIVAFAGDLGPPAPQPRMLSPFEATTGWMLCDGRLLDASDPTFKALFDAIRFSWGGDPRRGDFFNLPRLLGYFLRGVEPSQQQLGARVTDPEGGRRVSNNPGGNDKRMVGSEQDFSTAKPKIPFRTDDHPGHQHFIDFEINAARDVDGQDNTVANPWIGQDRKNTETGGQHFHIISSGGDSETRPLNAYVYWIIRFA